MHDISKNQNYGKRLRQIRSILGIQQRELAQELRVSPGAIALWETGKRPVPGPVQKLIELYEYELGIPTRVLTRALKIGKHSLKGISLLLRTVMLETMNRSRNQHDISDSIKTILIKTIVTSLADLKGLSMKLGQMLSYLDFSTTPEIQQIYSEMNADASALSPDLVARILSSEFSIAPGRIFSEWSPKPFALGSIGQVHRARLHSGEEVAVKIQYPKIVRTLKTDLATLGKIDSLMSLFFKGLRSGELSEELRARFLAECNYLEELQNQNYFYLNLKDSRAIIPRPYSELTTRNVLVSEFVKADDFNTFLKRGTQEEKNRAAETIFDTTFRSIFIHKIFNGDPHPGNYLFKKDKVVFLDFGCVKRFEEKTIQHLRELILASIAGDSKAIRETSVAAGMVPDVSNFDFKHHEQMLLSIYSPWIKPEVYRFHPEYIRYTWAMHFSKNPNCLRTRLPGEWLLLTRVQWGLCAILTRLDAESNWHDRINAILR